ncbi:hypothetical protein LCGC14_0775270 [marine sediment metagenome]|uniref:DprA winged helix domain-containing protein n=1 Tax=marine sediment metagenome TaxID=412755 RepID=A0A0F9T446_9ZZZZ
MKSEITEEVEKEIFKLISTPGVEIEDIIKKLNLDYDTVMNILSEEFLKHDFNQGRRLCCRF